MLDPEINEVFYHEAGEVVAELFRKKGLGVSNGPAGLFYKVIETPGLCALRLVPVGMAKEDVINSCQQWDMDTKKRIKAVVSAHWT